MAKRLARIFVSFGKGDGEKMIEQFLIEDTRENREELLEEYSSMSSDCFNGDAFINGQEDDAVIDMNGGDWDEPTGKNIVIFDKDELIDGVNKKYKKELNEIEELFKEEDDK